jgi:hypothetical protein
MSGKELRWATMAACERKYIKKNKRDEPIKEGLIICAYNKTLG